MTGISRPLLDWYCENRRVLPFREDPVPYHVWVSEMMLQQTQMATVLPYYRRFLAALPDIAALAACGEETLHKLWEGLGYYSRARNLQKAAVVVMQKYGGHLPADYDALLSLPGIGPYTAGAIASIAFGLPCPAVDGNVLRVAARLLADGRDVALPATKQALTDFVRREMPQNAPGDYNQALMELGALVCVPPAPRCGVCPLAALCAGYGQGVAAALPVKAPARAKAEEQYTVLVVRAPGTDGADSLVLLQKRPAGGLLAGLWQPLLLPGRMAASAAQAQLAALLPGAALGEKLPATRHVFTHKIWRMTGWLCSAPPGAKAPPGCVWAAPRQVRQAYTLPGAFKAYLQYFL